MPSYEAVSGSPELAAIRARAAAILQADLNKPVRTQAGSFTVGKGVLQGEGLKYGRGFEISEVDPRVGVSHADMYSYTGNVNRDMPKVQALINRLENNKKQIFDLQPRKLDFPMENVSHVKNSTITEASQTLNRVASIAPRQDTFDVMAPSMLPGITPPSFIPTNAVPNNLVDVDEETNDSDSQLAGDVYYPDGQEGAYGYATEEPEQD